MGRACCQNLRHARQLCPPGVVNTRFGGKAAASIVAISKPVFATVSQTGGRQCARRRQHVGLQPVQDAEIVEITRVSIYQQYTGGDAPLAYFAHKTLLRELVFMAPQHCYPDM